MKPLLIVLLLSSTAGAQFGIDCSGASPGSRCSSLTNSCLSSSNSSGCVVISSDQCMTCYFAGPATEPPATAQVLMAISSPGSYAEYGLRARDLVWKINGSGLNEGLDFTRINELRQTRDVILTVQRIVRGRWRIVTVMIPKY